MVRKVSFMVVAALAVSALSLPSGALADWTDGTVNVGVERTITVAGSIGFSGALGGGTCTEADGTGTLTPGTTGDFVSYQITNPTTTCKGSGGLVFCTGQSGTATGLPWTAHTNGATMTITGVHIDLTFTGAFCPYHEITLKGSTAVTPNNLHAATSGTISGTLEAFNGTTGAFIQNVSGTGSGTITPSGTYGIT
jgi:hypothetical protein